MESTLDLEHQVQRAHSAGAYREAVELVLHSYQQELRSFFANKLGRRALAEEAYSAFSMKFFRSFATFAWKCPLRAWVFVVAHGAANATLLQAALRREVPYAPHDQRFMELPARPRTTTAGFRQTGARERAQELRSQLDPADDTLLILHVESKLSWNEIAIVVGAVAPDAEKAAIDKAAVRLRTRYDTIRRKLRKLHETHAAGEPG